jgi:hypothetical protein
MDEKRDLLARADARFKRQEKNATEAVQARQDYDEKQAAATHNMHKLREARLSREAGSSMPSTGGTPVLSKKKAKRV